MRVKSVSAKNFGSYKDLSFESSRRGLTLIHGPTGSGKSTLCDVIPWVLFGITSKNGSVDEIRSWNTHDSTVVSANLDVKGRNVTIVRVRGSKANDLYYTIGDGEFLRGKDLQDTQKQINTLLGVTPELYLAGAYFHEFTQTAQFFVASAKNRRLICEQIVDMSLAITLSENIKNQVKFLKQSQNELSAKHSTLHGSFKSTQTALNSALIKKNNWTKKYNEDVKNWQAKTVTAQQNKDLKIEHLTDKLKKFESIKLKLNQEIELSQAALNLHASTCQKCGGKINTPEIKILDENLKAIQWEYHRTHNEEASVSAELRAANSIVIETAPPDSTNPYDSTVLELQSSLNEIQMTMQSVQTEHDQKTLELQDYNLMADMVDTFRASTIKNAIKDIEQNTNSVLMDYFDAEIQVLFEVSAADKLDVTIQKDGNTCSYSQLSKGQRQMLKLSFGISVMEQVSKHSGVVFHQIMLDEALDGLDESLKIKSYRLLEHLATKHDEVFVVEHSGALKQLFNNSLEVKMTNGHSLIHEE